MKVQICTPHYQEQCHIRFAQGVAKLQSVLASQGIDNQWQTLGATYVQVGRDILVNSFLKTDFTHLLFIDSDIVFNPMDALKLLEKDKDVVAGSYPVKDLYWDGIKAIAPHVTTQMLEHCACKSMIFRLPGEEKKPISNPQEPLEVTGAATGFMLIKREVFEHYRDHYHSRYEKSQRLNYPWYNEGELTQFFKVGYMPDEYYDGQHYGEDIWFCQMIRNIGRKIYTVPSINLGHMGQYTYYGCHWCAQGQVIHPSLMEVK